MTIEVLLKAKPFSAKTLEIDPEVETARIVEKLRFQLGSELRKRGLVLGLSGASTRARATGSRPAPWAIRMSAACSCRSMTQTRKACASAARPVDGGGAVVCP